MNEKNPVNQQPQKEEGEKTFFGIIVHSFFVIPFLIAVFCLLLFAGVHLLTTEQQTAYDYLEDVKTGGLTKRWQAAFELSKILSNPEFIPNDERFKNELIGAFRHSVNDDNRVRRYLALAMGRMGDEAFFAPLTANIKTENEDNLYAIIYALGMLQDSRAVNILVRYLEHTNPRIRSAAVVALGNIGDISAKNYLKKTLTDNEPNVQWGSAISLARLNDNSGKGILAQLLDREYLSQFPEVDPQEQNHLIIAAIQAARQLNEVELNELLRSLSKNDKNMKVRSAALEALNP